MLSAPPTAEVMPTGSRNRVDPSSIRASACSMCRCSCSKRPKLWINRDSPRSFFGKRLSAAYPCQIRWREVVGAAFAVAALATFLLVMSILA